MLSINKITSHSTVDFAAEELKKYLRMMNPNGGDIKIPYLCEVELLFEKQMDFHLIADTLRRRMARNVTANF